MATSLDFRPERFKPFLIYKSPDASYQVSSHLAPVQKMKSRIDFQDSLTPWRPSWISNLDYFSYFNRQGTVIHPVMCSSHLGSWLRRRFTNRMFKMASVAAIVDFESISHSVRERKFKICYHNCGDGSHLGFLIGTILAIFDGQKVTPIRPQNLSKSAIPFRRNISEDGGGSGHLGFLISMILAVFDLRLALILSTKLKVKWPFHSGDKFKIVFKYNGRGGHLGVSISTILDIFDRQITTILYQVSSQLTLWFSWRMS